MRDVDELFSALAKSRFRSRFKLSSKEAAYLKHKGLEEILIHARGFIETRLAPANPPNDGKQTPMRNHPAFVAQHATATCCRKCLQKHHRIPQNHPLTKEQIDYIIRILHRWLINAPV
ncbi:MAG: DUF4186 domain-containing protein [Planctomycetota bacterium]|jgi:hypothetical protein